MRLLLIASLLLAGAAQDPDGGIAPVGADGRTLNLDFEAGTLQDWTATGNAFEGQPVKGDSIYNGAMDNATGVASLLDVAALLKESNQQLRRSVLFVAVTAEEEGLLGSKFFAHHPTVGAGAIVANLN
ncbi:MAG: M20/M25/M40 family metallo-hydrolase [Planctomycetes bacterium]|nr:M20/M25/M40 family metallo-hydrolase [Planctomycetota bacterium]